MSKLSDFLVSGTSIPAQIEAVSPNLPKISTQLVNVSKVIPAGPDFGIAPPTTPTIPVAPAEVTKIFGQLPVLPALPEIPAAPVPVGARTMAVAAQDVVRPAPPSTSSLPGVTERVVSYRGM